jgi:hypothetical protein
LLAAACNFAIDNVPPEKQVEVVEGCGSLRTLANCGACDSPCEPQHVSSATCETGRCSYGSCVGEFLDCDGDRTNGCETDPWADPAHCGGCGHACSDSPPPNAAAYGCVDGVCQAEVCRSAFGDCDGDAQNGCETSLRTLERCGGCDLTCHPENVVGETCVDGTCRWAACEEPWGDCDGELANGCETDLRGDAAHCGLCGHGCGVDEWCEAGSCQGPPPPVVPFANEVEYEGWAYATLDDVPPDLGYGEWTDNCQSEWLELPYGWERAPLDWYSSNLAYNVVGAHTWSTSCIILADGHSYGTPYYGAGWDCGCWSTYECVEQAGDTYFRVIQCDKRLLIRRKL